MANEGETKVFLMENATTNIYTHVEKELASGAINSSNKAYTVTTAPVAITGLTVAAQVQYVETATQNYFRKDVMVWYRKNGADTPVDTTANPITISTTTLTFTTAPTATQADFVVVSYSHTASNRTDEVINTTPAGGGRPVEYVTVQGGEKIRIEKPQDQKTIQFEVLSVDGGFAHFVNGVDLTQTIAGATSGSDILHGTVGAQTRGKKTIVVKVTDPDTDNDRIEVFYNVVGVTCEGTAPSDGYWKETVSFECPPQDYCRLTRLVGQGA
jgi:hypothetical protein